MSRIAAIMRSSMAPRSSGSVNIDTQPFALGEGAAHTLSLWRG
jgi:hypothetical protein